MSDDLLRSRILERRARLVAAALAGASLAGVAGCCGENTSTVADARPQMCLSMRHTEVPISDAEFGKTYVVLATPKNAAKIRAEITATIEGTAPRTAADRTVGPMPLMRYRGCLINAAKRGESPSGTVTISFDIGAGGVENATVSANGDVSKTVQECLLEHLKGAIGSAVTGKPRVTITVRVESEGEGDAG